MMKNFYSIVIVIFIFFSCDYVKGVRDDTKKNISSHKNFIKEFSFNGVIIDKILCDSCKLNKFQIIINLKEIDINKIDLGNRSFPPYYHTYSDNKLNLSVNQQIYNNVEIGEIIKKNKHSNSIILNNKELIFISNKKEEWFLK